MIISDQHKFAFVHIPKCAGTSLRKALRPIDETDGQFDHIGKHPQMGLVNFGHLTLNDLATHFPDEYAKVAAFRSVAIVRDPIDRFFSAIFQRLREFKAYNQSQITAPVVADQAEALARYLSSSPGRLDIEYVHFNRQSDYVFDGPTQIVDRIFALHRLDDASSYIEACTGIRPDPAERENRTAVLRVPTLRPVVRLLHAPYSALVSLEMRNRIRRRMERAGVYGDLEKQRFVRPGSYVEGFMKEYYACDFDLFAAATAK